MYRIFLFEKSQIDKINLMETDDVLSRQSITKKDGSGYGEDGKIIVILEGSPDIFERVGKIVGKLSEPSEKKGKEIYNKIKQEEEDAQGGVGFLFG